MDLSGKRILVVGLGESGRAAARWLVTQGAHVTVSELKESSELDGNVLGDLLGSGVRVECGGHKVGTFLESDLIVVSPGIPLDIDPLAAAREKGLPIVGEIELAGRHLKTPAIGVTGTNGKSTVVKLIGTMLQKAGKGVFVGANFGPPLTEYIAGDQAADFVVLELSSFQLDTIETFSPLMALILNVSPDHLDRYRDYESYARSKERIFLNQRPGQILIVNDDDPWLRSVQPKGGPQVFRYGIGEESGRHAFLQDGQITTSIRGQETARFSLERFVLPGDHNRLNLMAAILASQLIKVSPPDIQWAVDQFEGLPHRLELVDEVRGVAFYNDSKATNIDAAIKSITSFSGPVILIAGGRHKGSDYLPLIEAASQNVRGAVFLGEAGGLLAEASTGRIPWQMATDMPNAVALAFAKAQEGDVVLLAPACSSFDMFRNFEHRGLVFREAVERLKDGG